MNLGLNTSRRFFEGDLEVVAKIAASLRAAPAPASAAPTSLLGAAGAPRRTIELDGIATEIVGVMPAGFHFPLGQRQGVWTTVAPLQAGKTPPTQQRSLRLFHLIGRRRAGAALPRVQAELAGIAGQLARQYPATDAHLAIRAQAEQRAVAGPARRTAASRSLRPASRTR